MDVKVFVGSLVSFEFRIVCIVVVLVWWVRVFIWKRSWDVGVL